MLGYSQTLHWFEVECTILQVILVYQQSWCLSHAVTPHKTIQISRYTTCSVLVIVTYSHYFIKKTAVGCMERQSVIVGGQPHLQLCEMEAEHFTRHSIADLLRVMLGQGVVFYCYAFADCAKGNSRGEFQIKLVGVCIL